MEEEHPATVVDLREFHQERLDHEFRELLMSRRATEEELERALARSRAFRSATMQARIRRGDAPYQEKARFFKDAE